MTNPLPPEGAQPKQVSAFEVTIVGKPDWAAVVNARTAGKAKAHYHRDLREPWPSIPFTAVRCRRLGPARSSQGFMEMARRRGVPDARCGQRVLVGKSRGVIIGHNSSLNFDVLFDDDDPKFAGLTLNVHPADCQFEVSNG